LSRLKVIRPLRASNAEIAFDKGDEGFQLGVIAVALILFTMHNIRINWHRRR